MRMCVYTQARILHRNMMHHIGALFKRGIGSMLHRTIVAPHQCGVSQCEIASHNAE